MTTNGPLKQSTWNCFGLFRETYINRCFFVIFSLFLLSSTHFCVPFLRAYSVLWLTKTINTTNHSHVLISHISARITLSSEVQIFWVLQAYFITEVSVMTYCKLKQYFDLLRINSAFVCPITDELNVNNILIITQNFYKLIWLLKAREISYMWGQCEISDSHGGEYEDDSLSKMLHRVVWKMFASF